VVFNKRIWVIFLSLLLVVGGSVGVAFAAPPQASTQNNAGSQVEATSNMQNTSSTIGKKDGTIVAQMGIIKMSSGEKIVLTFTGDQNLSSITTTPDVVRNLVQHKFAEIDASNIILTAEGLNTLVSGVIKQAPTLNTVSDRNAVAVVEGHIVIQEDNQLEHVMVGTSNLPSQDGVALNSKRLMGGRR